MASEAVDKQVEKSSSVLERLNLGERSWKFYAAASVPPLVAAGLALWYYSSRGAETSKKDDKKKRQRKTRKAKKSAKGADEAEGDEKAGTPNAVGASTATLGGDEENPEEMSDAQIAALSKDAAKKIAQTLKSRGNKFFQAKRYAKAIELYTQALRFDKDPVFFSNRAACYAADNEHEKVIEDCTEALKLEPQYVKALMRRAQAYESTSRFRDSLYDFTTACILEDFKNTLAATSAERVLKKLAETEARERVEKRQPRLPSKSFITGYLNSFRSNGAEATAEEGAPLSKADTLYNEALELIAAQDYAKAIEAIDNAAQ
ncbi:TOM (translocase of outer membrane) complex component, partial [Coemansia sp. BCRC 34490]